MNDLDPFLLPKKEPPDDTVTVKVRMSVLRKLLGPLMLVLLPSASTLGVNALTSTPSVAAAAVEQAAHEREKFSKEQTARLASMRAKIERCSTVHADVNRRLDSLRSAIAANAAQDATHLLRFNDFYAEKWGALLVRVARSEERIRALKRRRR